MMADLKSSGGLVGSRTQPRARRFAGAGEGGCLMRVLVATDACLPQINGVVRSLEHLAGEAPSFGAEISFLTPNGFRTPPLPGYREIRLALTSPMPSGGRYQRRDLTPCISQPRGRSDGITRHVCRKDSHPFTTSYHTRLPEYLAARLPVPSTLSYAARCAASITRGAGTMVGSPTPERI